jgi:hypothetical protein
MRLIQSGRLVNFTKNEYTAALNGMTALIERLTRTAESLNPQDENRQLIESKVGDMQRLRSQLQKAYEGLKNVNV